MQLTISGYSTALFSTWYFVEELGLLLDAGDGVSSSLLQKARKVKYAFISHADRDHLTGLLQFNQLNARPDLPKIIYPQHCGSFPALEEFSKKFDPHVSGTSWHPVAENTRVFIKEDIFVESIRNNHVPAAPGIFKSFGYKVCQVKHKLKSEFLALPQAELIRLMKKHGRETMMEQLVTNLLTYSGDTPVDDPQKWDGANILIHEATFLDDKERDSSDEKRNKHSTLEEVMRMVSQLSIGTLILGHFSSRYSHEEIDEKINYWCRELNITIPVFRVLPGQVHRDILNGQPIRQGLKL